MVSWGDIKKVMKNRIKGIELFMDYMYTRVSIEERSRKASELTI
jgi:hypothetical protein